MSATNLPAQSRRDEKRPVNDEDPLICEVVLYARIKQAILKVDLSAQSQSSIDDEFALLKKGLRIELVSLIFICYSHTHTLLL
jgi:hypothetical protein